MKKSWLPILVAIGLLGQLGCKSRDKSPSGTKKRAAKKQQQLSAPVNYDDLLNKEVIVLDEKQKLSKEELEGLDCAPIPEGIATKMGLDVSTLKEGESFSSCKPKSGGEQEEGLGMVGVDLTRLTRSFPGSRKKITRSTDDLFSFRAISAAKYYEKAIKPKKLDDVTDDYHNFIKAYKQGDRATKKNAREQVRNVIDELQGETFISDAINQRILATKLELYERGFAGRLKKSDLPENTKLPSRQEQKESVVALALKGEYGLIAKKKAELYQYKIVNPSWKKKSDLKEKVAEQENAIKAYELELKLAKDKVCFASPGCISFRNIGIVVKTAAAGAGVYIVAKAVLADDSLAGDEIPMPCEDALRGARLSELAYKLKGSSNKDSAVAPYSASLPPDRFAPNDIEVYDPAGGGYAFVWKEKTNDTCHVAFKGTSTQEDILVDLKSLELESCKTKGGKAIGNCGLGFINRLKDIRGKGVAGYTSLGEHVNQACDTVYIYGHSLGGALASLFAIEMTLDYPSKFGNKVSLQVFTYGEPKGVEENKAKTYHESIKKYRFLNKADPVVYAPCVPGTVLCTLDRITGWITPKRSWGHWGQTMAMDKDNNIESMPRKYTADSSGEQFRQSAWENNHKKGEYINRIAKSPRCQ